ncbi:MAG: tetratricopeptide repeat protein [candidate division KSB1 bacterium]|nr:tetratricopeptide repeat protein [candidate division KSB1 bacterium]
MPLDLLIRPNIPEHDLKVLTRLRQEFDHKLESQELPTTEEIIALGTHLWEALEHAVDGATGMEKILALREQAIAAATHVRLIIESGQPEIQALPWELTFHADQRLGFLNRNPDFTLLRRWQPPDNTTPDLTGRPLKILLFVASPEDLDPEKSRLDFETEENFLFAQLDEAISRGEVEIDVAEDGTLETLQARLENNVYHVVHCSMHGRMEEGHAVLFFEGYATGRQRAITPKELIDVWKNAKAPVPCFFLSACQSAQPDTQRAVPDFTRALLADGVPHVIGMRRSVADTAATHFAGHFYHALATGKAIDCAVTEARQKITGDLAGGTTDPHLQLFIELFQQWSIPVFYSRKSETALLDAQKPFQPQPRPRMKKIRIGGLEVVQEGFIGRRAAKRAHYRKWASGGNRHLLLCGIGGVGKTALAGHFSLRLRHEQPDLQIFAFAPPFDLAAIEEQLRTPFLQAANKNQVEKWQILEKPLDRLQVMLGAITAAVPTLFIFDNLESCLDLATRRFRPEHAATEKLIAAVQRQNGQVWTLLTCRYAIASDQLAHVTPAELPEASLGDILRFMRQWPWPETVSSDDKAEMYKTLGGNFRSIEWLSGLLTAREKTWKMLQQKFAGLTPPADTPEAARQTVAEAMRRDLIFEELLDQLTPAEKLLLQRLTLEPRPLIIDGLYALWDEPDNLENAVAQLSNYVLLETAHSPDLDLPTYRVAPLVVELLKRAPLSKALQRDTHARLARYWRYAGEKFTRLISDDWAAFEHFTLAGMQQEADEMRASLSREYFGRQQFGVVVELLLPFVQRRGQTAPWWALNLLGQSLHHLGQYDAALQRYLSAEKLVKKAKTKEEKKNLSTTLNNISQIYSARGDYATALSYLEESLKISREIGDRQGEGTTLGNIGNIYLARGDYATALDYLQQSLKIRREIGDRQGEGATLGNIGNIYRARGDYATALYYLQQSLKILRAIGDRQGEGTTLNNISQIYDAAGDYATALSYLEKSLAIQREIGDRKGEGATLNNISQIYDARGDYATALSYLEESLKIRREIGDRQGEGATLNNISQIYDARGDYATALSYLEESLKISREIGDRQGEGATLNNLATTAYAGGDYATALKYLEESLKISREIGDRKGEGATLNNISQIYSARGDYGKALEYLEKSLAIQREIGDRQGEGTTLNNIAGIYLARGDYDTALDYLQQSLKISREIGDRKGEGATLNNISQIYDARGDYATALDYLQQSLKILREIGDRQGEGATLNNLATTAYAGGDYATALDYLQQSLKILREIGDRKGEGTTLGNIGDIYRARWDYATALKYLEESLKIRREIGDRKGEGTTLNNLATTAYAGGDYATALEYLQQSLKILREISDRAGMIPTLHNLALIYLQNQQLEAALQSFMEALQLAHETNYAEGIFNVSRDLGRLLCDLGQKKLGLPLLRQALEVGRQIGHPGTDEVQKLLQEYTT